MKKDLGSGKKGIWKRLLILSFTLTAAILAVVFGSSYYVSKNSRQSIEYSGGVEYLAKVSPTTNSPNADKKALASIAAEDIYNRISITGVKGAKVETEIIKDEDVAAIRIKYPGISSSSEIKAVENKIIEKSHFTLTDVYGNLLFRKNGLFNTILYPYLASEKEKDPKKALVSPNSDTYQKSLSEEKVPLLSDSPKSFYNTLDQEHEILTFVDPAKSADWIYATRYISGLPEDKRKILVWLDLDNLIKRAQTNPTLNKEWSRSGFNPYNFVHVNNDPKAIYRKYQFDGQSYLIGNVEMKEPLRTANFIIKGENEGYNIDRAKKTAERIKYAISNYRLDIQRSRIISASHGKSSFDKIKIAAIAVSVFIALFLIINYGFLGFLSSISFALYAFVTVSLFTLMKAEFSPATMAALILGFGISVDSSIIVFERFKQNIHLGDSSKLANWKSQTLSIKTIIDSNLIVMIVAFLLFFMGITATKGISLMMIFSLAATLLVSLLFTRLSATLLVNTNIFDKRKWLLGVSPKLDNWYTKVFKKANFKKVSKGFTIFSSIIFILGILIFAVFSGINRNLNSGLNLSQSFSGGSVISISKSNYDSFSKEEINEVETVFKNSKIPTDDVDLIYSNDNPSSSEEVISVEARTSKEIDLSLIKDFIENKNENKIVYKLYDSQTTKDFAFTVLKNSLMVIGIALALIFIYVLMRFRWTFAIASLLALVHNALIVFALFVIFRLEVSPLFMNILLLTMAYSIHDTIILFDRLREKLKATNGAYQNKEQIEKFIFDSIVDTLKRSIFTSFTTAAALIILIGFGGQDQLILNLGILFGVITGTYSSLFITSFVWKLLEFRRQKMIKKRIEKNFWNTQAVSEQIFRGINDFRP